jgi:UDP-N-acetylglucosamine acyltransferase
MNVEIDKLAVVTPGAKLGDGCQVGPFCTIGADVEVGKNTRFRSHVVVDGHTSIGSDCDIFPFTTIGIQSQDLKFRKGNITHTKLGDRNIIREFVSIHSGTEDGTSTVVGDDCALLAHAHIGHNCTIGDHVTMGHSATLGGHVLIGDFANIGGLSAVHQFCHVGRAAMVGGMSRVIQDVLPFTIAEGFPAHMRVINKVGMERAGYTKDQIAQVRKAFRVLFMRELRLEQAVEQVLEEFKSVPEIQLMVDAITASQRGLARPESATFEINVG